MKLLNFELGNIPNSFRSLHAGFKINFHSLSDTEGMEDFRPFCFAGLNGSGKSNVLEALASIFYHLEICVAQYLPDSIKNPDNFKRNECSPDAFTLEYLIGQHDGSYYSIQNFHKVAITKRLNEEPKMEIQEFPFDDSKNKVEIELNPLPGSGKSAPGKAYLPDHIIGYSSGENEILSLPFIKSRLVHLDEFMQATKVGQRDFTEPENGLIFIDNYMSQAVLLACLLFESEDTLKPLKDIDNTGILDLKSFRMNINLLHFNFQKDKKENILKILEHNQIDKLKKCATSWHTNGKTLWLDFYVTPETKEAFKHHFNDNSFELFQLFQLLYELNSHFVNENIKEDVYQSNGYYTDGKLPAGSPEQNIFHFLDFYITKKIKDTGEIKDLLLRNFSDGEHQFLHTIGICLLLKSKRVLLLLDEPETHFNPSWRAKFIKILNESITAGNNRNYRNGHFNVHYLKDILLTSHSPFIISDCMPHNVLFFDRNKETKKVQARKASELGLNTYGTSTELILDRLFNYNQSIGDLSNDVLENVDFKNIDSKDKVDEIKSKLRILGESIEKDMVLARLNRIKFPK
ncbi:MULTISPECIES: restriction system-associated AAA family ATPase [Flavobacteriaceae]|uniref:Restriction system-associated AAA family ATPase n=2 Tax=Flavobacteriaceae TaxID=49546 RepID=A0A4Y8AT37_9FLAO|nr:MULTISPECIES: restriction system-associated AAA family ATPase [Flavobacteriaceae]TEW73826.1 restriction system-associated AAA family ATPase [Gramella jeungdoensis]GGK37916.1 ABC transporter [Lutibacter litoralis]